MAIVALILQTTLFYEINIAGVKPDIILVLVICISVVCGPRHGGFVGLTLGLLEDLYLGRFIGMNSICKGTTGIIVGWFTLGAFSENLLVPIISVFLGTVLNGLIYFISGKILGLNWTMNLWLWNTVPLAIFNMCLVPFIYHRFYYFAQGLGEYRINPEFWERFS
jgi:rod shape-determining protein MreD